MKDEVEFYIDLLESEGLEKYRSREEESKLINGNYKENLVQYVHELQRRRDLDLDILLNRKWAHWGLPLEDWEKNLDFDNDRS